MLSSLFSKPYSRLYIVGDHADWAIDEEAKALSCIAKEIGLKPSKIKRAWLDISQIVHYSSQFALLNPKIYKNRHKISVDYFHGKPEDGESYARCFEALKTKKEISGIRVSNTIMEKTLIEAGVPRAKVTRIPIGIDLPLFTATTRTSRKLARERLGIPQNAVVVGSFQKDGVGWGEGDEPKTIKGPDVFIRVVERLHKEIPNLFVLLSGPSRGYVKNELKKMDIPFVHEYVKRYRDVSSLYDALDLYLITSREEGGPKACLEAMSKGIPLVSTAVGQCVDLIKSGENAMMNPIEDASALTESCLKVIKDNTLKARLIKNGLVTAERHSLKNQLPLWRKYFSKL